MVDIITSDISEEENNLIVGIGHKRFFNTNLQFLISHNGWRPSNVHTILGVAHGGKSTLVRTILNDIVINNPEEKALIVLSEETNQEFLAEFLHKTPLTKHQKRRVHILSEVDSEETIPDGKQYFSHLKDYMERREISFILFDNITTSKVYMDQKVKEQAIVSKQYKSLAIETDGVVVLVAHTGANPKELIEMNDIRGSKAIVNLSQFFYILQTIHIGSLWYNTIRILKHRGQELGMDIFKLNYDKTMKMFSQDIPINWDDFKKAWKKRNKL